MAPSQPTLKLAGVLTTDEEWAAALVPDEKGSLSVIESYAGWCGPSDAATSTLTRMSVEMQGRRIKFYQVRQHPLRLEERP